MVIRYSSANISPDDRTNDYWNKKLSIRIHKHQRIIAAIHIRAESLSGRIRHQPAADAFKKLWYRIDLLQEKVLT
jgi:hypothetical protein